MQPQSFESNNPYLQDTALGSKYFNPDYLFNQGVEYGRQFFDFISNFRIEDIADNILTIFSLFFLTIIFYSAVRLFEIRAKEHKHLQHELAEYAHHQAEREKKKQEGEAVSTNPRWMKTLNYLFSHNSSDWKLAIIEADEMLNTLMGDLGFGGENLGERLKSATQENFRNLSLAWEAHTLRNRIAHEGLSFEFSQYEAKRVIAIYEKIFREYGFI